MKILVTGGAGFIGSAICKYLLKKGHEVRVLDNLSSANSSNLNDIQDKIEIVNSDIRYYQEVKRAAEGMDAICHLAAIAVVPASFMNPRESFDVNLYGTLNVLEAAKEIGIRKIVFASSSAVYGNLSGTARKEDASLDPKSPYAITKIAMEYFMKMFAEQGIDTCSLRLFNVYGPNQDPKYFAVIPNFAQRALENKEIIIHGSGKQTRDFVYVEDVAEAFEKALHSKTSGAAINIAFGSNLAIKNLAEQIIKLTNSKSKIVFDEARKGDVDESLADISLAKKILGWTPKYSLEQGLRKTIESIKN